MGKIHTVMLKESKLSGNFEVVIDGLRIYKKVSESAKPFLFKTKSFGSEMLI